jgi:hypothetical protein
MGGGGRCRGTEDGIEKRKGKGRFEGTGGARLSRGQVIFITSWGMVEGCDGVEKGDFVVLTSRVPLA